MLTHSGRPVALAAMAALLAAFALAFGIGKATKDSTAPAAVAPHVPELALPTQKPKVSSLQTAGTLPALRAKRHKPEPSPTPPKTNSTPGNTTPTPPKTNPTPTPPKTNPPNNGNDGGVIIGGGTH